MTTIKTQKTQNGHKVWLAGVIDENTNFNELFKSASGHLSISCKEVTKINSAGVKGWINFFTSLNQKGINVTFTEVSVILVEQLNSLSNFTGGGSVESIFVPYACTNKACRKETDHLCSVADLKANPDLEPIKCIHCGSNSEFDDLPEEYLAFLGNQ